MNRVLFIVLLAAATAQGAAAQQAGPVFLQDAGGNVINTYPTIQQAYDAIPARLPRLT